jgi:light-regulated signal transduction histidine kinase (bacteriophytochrome)
LSTGQSMDFEETGTFHGRDITFLTTRSPLCDEQGAIWGVIGIATDITERKQLEINLAKQAAELEAINKELESFSYSVSHDLRAPLRAIDGFSRIILKKHAAQLDAEAVSKFDIIRSNTEKMGQLIDDLLSFSRLGKAELSRRMVDMNLLVREVLEELEAANPDRNITFKIDPLPQLMVDQHLMKQVWSNLLANAVKFTRNRDVALIEVGVRTEQNDNICFIRDNGAGFDMKYHDKMFGVFQRLHLTSEYEGTGVGLAIVQRIIHRHGGRIWAQGEVDKGATFYFSLDCPSEIV